MSKRYMTKADAVRIFRHGELRHLREQEWAKVGGRSDGGGIDWGARAQAWHWYIDALNKDGAISNSQVERWSDPSFVVPPWRR